MRLQAQLKDDSFLDDVDGADDKNELYLWWLGQSGFLLTWQQKRLLIDPYLSDSLTRKYENTTTPHVRMVERVVDPARLKRISTIAVTHHHTDHADPDTLRSILRVNPEASLIAPAASMKLIHQRLGLGSVAITGLDDGATININGFRITGVAAAHEKIEHDDSGHCRYLGYVIQRGAWTIYHSGDTILYEGLAERLGNYRIDLALLPINGRDRGVAGNLTATEACRLSKHIEARCVIPCHYNMFLFNTTNPNRFREAAEQADLRFRICQCGERVKGSELVAYNAK